MGGSAGGGRSVGWLVGCTTRLWQPVPPPPPQGSPLDGPMPRQWLGVALSAHASQLPLWPAHLYPTSPYFGPLAPAPVSTVPRTIPVSASPAPSPSPDMNLSSPFSVGTANFMISSHPVPSLVPSQVPHEPAHHLRPPLKLQHRDHMRGHILSPRDNGLVVSSSPPLSQACPTTRQVGDH